MIVVTGGFGMIGSNLVGALGRLGRRDIVVVDNLTDGNKVRNLCDARIADFHDKSDFLSVFEAMTDVEVVFHLGACSSTTHADGRYVMENNFGYSSRLLEICLVRNIPLVYASSASVYGNSGVFREEPECERPLSAYALSKRLFDEKVRHMLGAGADGPVAGMRFFNVYGPGEHHKAGMHSPMFRFFTQISRGEPIQVFSEQFEGAEEPRRDFVHVADVVSALLWAWQTAQRGLFNVGTGEAHSFQEVAEFAVEAMGRGKIERVAFPRHLAATYQRRTCACLSKLRDAGFTGQFCAVKQGLIEYYSWLQSDAPLVYGPASQW